MQDQEFKEKVLVDLGVMRNEIKHINDTIKDANPGLMAFLKKRLDIHQWLIGGLFLAILAIWKLIK